MLFLSKKMSTEHPEDMIPITKNYQNKNTDILFQEITHHKNAVLRETAAHPLFLDSS